MNLHQLYSVMPPNHKAAVDQAISAIPGLDLPQLLSARNEAIRLSASAMSSASDFPEVALIRLLEGELRELKRAVDDLSSSVPPEDAASLVADELSDVDFYLSVLDADSGTRFIKKRAGADVIVNSMLKMVGLDRSSLRLLNAIKIAARARASRHEASAITKEAYSLLRHREEGHE